MANIFGIYLGQERQEKKMADALYANIVSAARNPNLYGTQKVPDTANGRFELIILHIFMLFRRLQDDEAKVQSIKQKTFDRFLEDMDVNLREIGVGPDGVPKRIQKMLENFYGRAAAYQKALETNDLNKIAEVIARNFYTDNDASKLGATMLAKYVSKSVAYLEAQDIEILLNSNFNFPLNLNELK